MQRVIIAAILALAVVIPTVSPAQAAIPNLRKYAGIVVDAKTGRVLYEENADGKRYPASVAKVMTLYILFQELKAGRIKLSDKMTVSRHAASAVPTKLGLRAGATISVENAIKSLVTLSANDMARVIAEHISGTESKFAERMTATARALGMNNTTYRNASGLPDANQLTTARDQARLGIAVYQHFPDYYEYFQTKSFTYNKRTYGNHNRLLGSNGIDGIKTGYINAAGSNLLTAARTDNRHIVVVGFGFNTASARDSKVRSLVSTYLPKARSGSYYAEAVIPQPGNGMNYQVAASGVPVNPLPRPYFFDEVPQLALASVDPLPAAAEAAMAVGSPRAPIPAPRPLDIIGTWIDTTFSAPTPAPAPAALGQTPPSAPLPPVGIGQEGEALDLMTSGAIASAQPVVAGMQPFGIIPGPQPIVPPLEAQGSAADPEVSGWIVQIGAAPSEQGANQLLGDAASKIDALTNFQSYVQRFENNGQVFFRARFAGFSGRDAATTMCDQLKQMKMSCLAMQG